MKHTNRPVSFVYIGHEKKGESHFLSFLPLIAIKQFLDLSLYLHIGLDEDKTCTTKMNIINIFKCVKNAGQQNMCYTVDCNLGP